MKGSRQCAGIGSSMWVDGISIRIVAPSVPREKMQEVSPLCGGRWKSAPLMASFCSETHCKFCPEKEGNCELGGWRG